MKQIDLKNIDPSLLNQLEISAAQDQISRDLNGEAVILNTKTGLSGLGQKGLTQEGRFDYFGMKMIIPRRIYG